MFSAIYLLAFYLTFWPIVFGYGHISFEKERSAIKAVCALEVLLPILPKDVCVIQCSRKRDTGLSGLQFSNLIGSQFH